MKLGKYSSSIATCVFLYHININDLKVLVSAIFLPKLVSTVPHGKIAEACVL